MVIKDSILSIAVTGKCFVLLNLILTRINMDKFAFGIIVRSQD